MMENQESHSPNENDNQFVKTVMKLFNKLMMFYTKGKYETPEEKEFFSDDSKLYDFEGKPTEAYKLKIKEYEDYVRNNDVSVFLKDVHSEDSDAFGEAYGSQEKIMLNSACAFIDNQEVLVRELYEVKERLLLNRQQFNFDFWFSDYCNKQGILPENIEEAKQHFVDEIDDLLSNDPELRDMIKSHINCINEVK